MKQVLLDPRTGEIRVEDVPEPALERGTVLVANRASLISTGTERAKTSAAEKSLLGKAMERPDLVGKVLEKVERDGVLAAWRAVKDRLDRPMELGYSSSGVVLAVAPDVPGIRPADRVACAGGGYALHAGVVRVPTNLVVRLPDTASHEEGAFAALGAIALQGVRRAAVEIGERVVVVGLGLVGLLSIQILRAAGARAIGIDLDHGKLSIAQGLGFDECWQRFHPELEEKVACATAGRGADAVLVTAESRSGDPLVLAGRLVRERGRVVVVGGVRMEFDREPYYMKEADLVFSRSYGPGRYDRQFEEKGLVYPHAYVPWTEHRNMECFLDLVASGAVKTAPLVTAIHPVEEAARAFERLGDPSTCSVALLLAYGPDSTPSRVESPAVPPTPRDPATLARLARIDLGVIGAGRFAGQYLLPAFARHPAVRLVSVSNRTGASTLVASRRHPFQRIADDPEEILADPEVNTVLIATRHDLHAGLAARALRAGKHVFLEKPPAIDRAGLEELRTALAQFPDRILFVGYNRRWAPGILALAEHLRGRPGPLVLSIRVAAGPLPDDHWLLDPDVGGGRLVGEACHFVDLACHLVGTPVTRIAASRAREADRTVQTTEDFSLSLEHGDGSLSTILYTSRGAARTGKERYEAFAGTRTGVLDDHRTLVLAEGRKARRIRLPRGDRGHKAEVSAFLELCLGSPPLSTSPDGSLAGMELLFSSLESLGRGIPVECSPSGG